MFLILNISDKNTNNNISEEYSKCFAELVTILRHVSLNLSKNVIEYVSKFVKFNANIKEKCFCVFFCSQLIQILKKDSDDLINCFFALYTDFENKVRKEVAHELSFVTKVKNQEFFNRNLSTVFKKYFEDNDIAVQAEAIISILENFDKVYDDENINAKLLEKFMSLVSSNEIEKKPHLKTVTKLVKSILTISKANIKVAKMLEKVIDFVINVSISLTIFIIFYRNSYSWK